MPFNNIGPMELMIVLVIALIVIGPQKLPDVARSVGRGMREFKESISGDRRDHDDYDDDDDDDVEVTPPLQRAK
jgi:sec-independent protein translocase protein TatA